MIQVHLLLDGVFRPVPAPGSSFHHQQRCPILHRTSETWRREKGETGTRTGQDSFRLFVRAAPAR